jgi:hypothetical protein
MFNPPTPQDEWVLMFVIQLMTLGHPGDKGVMAMLGRELYPKMGHLLPEQAAIAAYVNLQRQPGE